MRTFVIKTTCWLFVALWGLGAHAQNTVTKLPAEPVFRHGVHADFLGIGGLGSLNYRFNFFNASHLQFFVRAGLPLGSYRDQDVHFIKDLTWGGILGAGFRMGEGRGRLEGGFHAGFNHHPTRVSEWLLSPELAYSWQLRSGLFFKAFLSPVMEIKVDKRHALTMSGGIGAGYFFQSNSPKGPQNPEFWAIGNEKSQWFTGGSAEISVTQPFTRIGYFGLGQACYARYLDFAMPMKTAGSLGGVLAYLKKGKGLRMELGARYQSMDLTYSYDWDCRSTGASSRNDYEIQSKGLRTLFKPQALVYVGKQPQVFLFTGPELSVGLGTKTTIDHSGYFVDSSGSPPVFFAERSFTNEGNSLALAWTLGAGAWIPFQRNKLEIKLEYARELTSTFPGPEMAVKRMGIGLGYWLELSGKSRKD